MRLNKPIVAVTAVAFLALAACGGSGGNGGPPGSPGQTAVGAGGGAGQGKDPNRQAPAAPIPGAQKGGIIKEYSALGLTTMDPTEAYYLNAGSILSNLVTRSLTQYAYDPKSKQMILIPDLATDLGTPNKDYTSWKFTIRKGVKWGENGKEVTPQDVVFGIERSFDRATFPGGPQYSNQYFLDGNTYKGPYKSGKYKGITVKGWTITIKMAKPFPDMPYWGAFPAMGPIPPDKSISDPAKYAQHPWSTGPYMFKDYTPEKSLTLVKNKYWDPNTDPGRHQYVDGWDMQFDTPSAKIDQIMIQDTGDGQNSMSIDDILSTDYVNFVQKSKDRLLTGTSPCTYIWYPDNRKITNINVRRAIGYAYPYRDAWAAAGYIEGVTRSPATNVMPPGVPGRVEYNPLPGHTPGTTDTAKAHQLLSKAHALGYVIKFPYATDNPQAVDVKDAVVASLTKAGFKPSPVATTTSQISSLIADPNAPVNVRAVGWCSDWPSGATWLPPEFQTTDIKGSGLGANYEAFSSKAVDSQINKIQLMPLSKQPAAWNALDQTIQTKYYPLVVTGYGGIAEPRGSNVMGMNNDTTYGMPTWRDMWLKQ
jgi:peptide/nickel transport system substrate-binding protein